jgi:hypothetical protein
MVRKRKFVSFTVFRNLGGYRYLYRTEITNDKNRVVKGKGVDPVKTTTELAQYFYNIVITNSFYPFAGPDIGLYEIILFKLDEIYSRSSTTGNRIGLVSYLEIFEDVEEGTQVRLVFSEKELNSRSRYGLWGFTEEEADSVIYLTIYGGNASTNFQSWQTAGGGGAITLS